jgi:hypothetical protein
VLDGFNPNDKCLINMLFNLTTEIVLNLFFGSKTVFFQEKLNATKKTSKYLWILGYQSGK